MQMATDTPMMLPVPTREAVDTISAWKEDTLPSFSGRSTTTRMASRSSRSCGNRFRMVKNSPAATSRITSR